VIAAEGLPVQLATRVLGIPGIEVLRVARPGAIGAGGAARLAH
jgi:hypothetical protein